MVSAHRSCKASTPAERIAARLPTQRLGHSCGGTGGPPALLGPLLRPSPQSRPSSAPTATKTMRIPQPGFSRPSRLSLQTSRLWHSSVVVFMPNLYQLPLPTPPIFFSRSFCRNHKANGMTRSTVSPNMHAHARKARDEGADQHGKVVPRCPLTSVRCREPQVLVNLAKLL